MKRALVTGLNGRLAPILKKMLEDKGCEVFKFDRNELNVDDKAQQQHYIETNQIDCIFHLANGSEAWAETLADLAHVANIPYLYTSTESVFEPTSTGPFLPDRTPDATGDYGAYKIRCEKLVLAANPNAIIARLGWQMFDTFEKDNLLTHVRDMHDEKGHLDASNEWIPAVAFVNDTFDCVIKLVEQNRTGIFHIGGNEKGLTFYDLVQNINHKYKMGWDVRPGNEPSRDGRVIDDQITCGCINDQFN